MKQPTALIILDGFGYRAERDYNSVYHGHPQNFNSWLRDYPHALLEASGEAVGLLPHMIGNSEVGHLTIGAGRIIKQPVARLHELIDTGELFKNSMLLEHFEKLKKTGGTLHVMGLLSDAGVHSHEKHLYALLQMAADNAVSKIMVHAFLDGRDVPPASAEIYLTRLEDQIQKLASRNASATSRLSASGEATAFAPKISNTGLATQITIGSLHGRFYAMDRDNNWDRTGLSYQVLTQSQVITFNNWRDALKSSYESQVTDEFVMPVQLDANAAVQPGDAVIFFNFRADRARQLTRALIDKEIFPEFYKKLNWIVTATCYNSEFSKFNVCVLLHKKLVTPTFLDCLEQANKKIFTIAETEKYAHITYFFNGGREIKRDWETRILIPSVKHLETYASHPRMSADAITKTVVNALQAGEHDFYLINYANADMVGHSGDFQATNQAVACLDEQLAQLYTEIVEKQSGTLYITADHGKAEEMWDYKLGQPRTAHTTNPVYFLTIKKQNCSNSEKIRLSGLSDIAPFILQELNLEVPEEMR